MQAEVNVKQQVRAFYDEVGWSEIGEGTFQNARYEDLRPVSRRYIQRCHARVKRYLPAGGTYLLDAGSGPIQYPEYLEYSAGYRFRVCLDLSIRALLEARRRIGRHGLYVVGDMAQLPFKAEAIDGVVSMHAVHHLPNGEQLRAFSEFERVLQPGGKAAVVYSWGSSLLMSLASIPIRVANAFIQLYRRLPGMLPAPAPAESAASGPVKTYTYKHDFRWANDELGYLTEFRVRVWRSVSTSFLRALIHRRALGGLWLELLYWIEELAPRLFGIIGQYPLISFCKN